MFLSYICDREVFCKVNDMKLNEIVTSTAVGDPQIPKRLYQKVVRRPSVETNVFLDFVKKYEDERKKKKQNT